MRNIPRSETVESRDLVGVLKLESHQGKLCGFEGSQGRRGICCYDGSTCFYRCSIDV